MQEKRLISEDGWKAFSFKEYWFDKDDKEREIN